jgi:hypothetical protein
VDVGAVRGTGGVVGTACGMTEVVGATRGMTEVGEAGDEVVAQGLAV